jgi:hypothetical protein
MSSKICDDSFPRITKIEKQFETGAEGFVWELKSLLEADWSSF